MLRLGAIVRLLMLAACLVPFTSERQAAGALAPYVPLTAASTPGEAPVGEEGADHETGAKERLTAPARHRPAAREPDSVLPHSFAAHPMRFTRARVTPPVVADPFHNGLGTPYRC